RDPRDRHSAVAGLIDRLGPGGVARKGVHEVLALSAGERTDGFFGTGQPDQPSANHKMGKYCRGKG
ncbi:MAG: hypothetical protein WBL81_04520, partial [Pseudolabrys sp.]